MKPEILIFDDPQVLAAEAARTWGTLAAQRCAEQGRFAVALAGGNTPRLLYQTLARPPWREAVPWERVEVFFGDERCVPPDHPDSNYRMAREALLDRVPIPEARRHRMAGEENPQQAAARYARLLETTLPREEGVPVLDLALLGLGTDGHIASLFPDTPALDVCDRWTVAVWVEKLQAWRLTLTYPVFEHARHLWILVTGANKREIVDRVLNRGPNHMEGTTAGAEADRSPSSSPLLPAERLQCRGRMVWYLDRAAAAGLLLPRRSRDEEAGGENPA